jgi:hypothetical protein
MLGECTLQARQHWFATVGCGTTPAAMPDAIPGSWVLRVAGCCVSQVAKSSTEFKNQSLCHEEGAG